MNIYEKLAAVQQELRKIEAELTEWQPVAQWLYNQKNREAIFSLRFIQSELPDRKHRTLWGLSGYPRN